MHAAEIGNGEAEQQERGSQGTEQVPIADEVIE
jgi:hypothetical protein